MVEKIYCPLIRICEYGRKWDNLFPAEDDEERFDEPVINYNVDKGYRCEALDGSNAAEINAEDRIGTCSNLTILNKLENF